MLELLPYLLNRENYLKYRKYVPEPQEVVLKRIFSYLDEMSNQLARDLQFGEFSNYVLACWPNVTKSDKDTLELANALLRKLSEVCQQEDSAQLVLERIRDRENSYKLAELYLQYSDGKITKEELSERSNALAEPFTMTSEDEDPFVSETLSELADDRRNHPGLSWRLNSLNRSLGPLRTDFGFIFARPEVGKTSWLCSEGSYMLQQLVEAGGGPLLWINNEEESKKVKSRFIQSWFGVTAQELWQNSDHFSKLFEEETQGKFLITRNSTTQRYEIERMIKQTQPGLIICDALDALEGFKADREDLRLGSIFKWAQEVSKAQQCPFIGVTWADGTAEGVKYLHMGHVTNAKTEKQKPAGFILGIGSQHDDRFQSVRHFYVSKNKLDGGVDSEESMRHAKIDVLIKPEIARFEDI